MPWLCQLVAMTDTELLAWIRGACVSGRAQSIREAASISRSELARDVGVTEPTVSRWENGARSPKGDAALRYAEVLRRLDRFVKRQAVPA